MFKTLFYLLYEIVFKTNFIGTVIGLLKLARTDPHLNHKGSHASTTHTSYSLPWFETHVGSIDREIQNGSLSVQDEAGMQPLYRNFLLQELYNLGLDDGRTVIDDTQPKNGKNFYQYVSVAYGSWIPPRESNDTEELKVMEAPAIVPLPADLLHFGKNGPNMGGNPNRRLLVIYVRGFAIFFFFFVLFFALMLLFYFK